MNCLQKCCHPKMNKHEFKQVWEYFNNWGGRITKCLKDNKVIGYMVRVKSDIYKDVVYLHYYNIDLSNKCDITFEKTKAILETIIGGNRYHDWCIKHDKKWKNNFEMCKNIVNEKQYEYMNEFINQTNKYFKDNKKELIVF